MEQSSSEMDSEEAFITEEDIDEIIDLDEKIDNNDLIETSMIDSVEEENTLCIFRCRMDGPIFCGSLSKNGEVAITGSKDDTACIWNIVTGDIIFKCTNHVDSVIFADFSYKELYLATGDMNGYIQLWQIDDKTRIWEYNMNDIVWMKWHHSANILFAASIDGEIYMWKLPEGYCKIFQGYGDSVETAILFPNGNYLAVGYTNGTIRILDLKNNSVLSTISSNIGHNSVVTCLDCYMDNNLLISASTDGSTILSTANNGKIICVLQKYENNSINNQEEEEEEEEEDTNSDVDKTNWVESIAFCKDPSFSVAAAGTINGDLLIWNITKQVLRQCINAMEEGISKIAWKGNTSLIFVAGLKNGLLKCFDAKTGTCIHLFHGHTADILDLFISEDGKKVLTTSDDATARVYDISSIC